MITAQYIRFDIFPPPSGSKTRVWEVITTYGKGQTLGYVKWYSHWRKYSFFPESCCLFEPTCLREIANFCEEQTHEHNRQLRLAKKLKVA